MTNPTVCCMWLQGNRPQVDYLHPVYLWQITYGGQMFAVTNPSTWNSLPKPLRDPSYSTSVIGYPLKTYPFLEYYCTQCIRGFGDVVLYKFMFYIILRYICIALGFFR